MFYFLFCFWQAKGANIEAVIRLEDDKEGKAQPMGTNRTAPKRDGAGVIKLVDAQDNQFVLAKGKDTTIPHEDAHFIQVWVLKTTIKSFSLCW